MANIGKLHGKNITKGRDMIQKIVPRKSLFGKSALQEQILSKNGAEAFIRQLKALNVDLSKLNESARTDIAMTAAINFPQDVAELVDHFKIGKPDQQRRLALLIAKQNGYAITSNIDRFRNLNDDDLKNITSILLSSFPVNASMFISKALPKMVAIEHRFALLKLAAQYDVPSLCDNIGRGKLADESKRVELAILAAKTDAKTLSKNIKAFLINDELKRANIFLIALETDPAGTAPNAKEFTLQYNLINGFISKVSRICEKAKINFPSF